MNVHGVAQAATQIRLSSPAGVQGLPIQKRTFPPAIDIPGDGDLPVGFSRQEINDVNDGLDCTGEGADWTNVSSLRKHLQKLLNYQEDHVAIWTPVCADKVPRYFFLRSRGVCARAVAIVLIVASLWAGIIAPIMAAYGIGWPLHDQVPSRVEDLDCCIGLLYGFGALIVRVRTSVLDERQEREIVEPREVLRASLLSMTLWVDTLSLAPSLLYIAVPLWGVRRWLHLLALLRLWRLGSPVPSWASTDRYGWSNYIAVGRLLALTFLVGHFYACLWLVMLDISESRQLQVWVSEEAGMLSIYSQALFVGAGVLYAQYVPTPGSMAERVFTVALFPIAATVMAVLFAQIVMIASRITIISSRCHEHMAYIQSATLQLGLEPALRHKIGQYQAFLLRYHDTEMFTSLFGSLSEPLLIQVKLQLFRLFICEAPLLQGLGRGRLIELVRSFEEFVYCPGDLLVRHGDKGKELFFIIKGLCDIFDESLNLIETKRKGDYFGEVCLIFHDMLRTANVRARTFCVIAKLTWENFDRIMPEGCSEKVIIRERIASFNNVVLPDSLGQQAASTRPTEERSSRRLSRSQSQNDLAPEVPNDLRDLLAWRSCSAQQPEVASGVALSPRRHGNRRQNRMGFRVTGANEE